MSISIPPPPPPPFFPLPANLSPPFNSAASAEAHPSSPFDNLKPSILIIILILSITLLVSVSLCLLLRLLNRRCLHLSSAASTTTTTTTTVSHRHVTTSSRRVSPQIPESSVLDSLPLFTFGSINRSSGEGGGDCAVCLSKFEPPDQLRLLPLCCHAFHAGCIDAWLLSNQTCPLCRSPIIASESDILKALSASSAAEIGRSGSFRLEIGSVSRRSDSAAGIDRRSSYSIGGGSFDYIVDEEDYAEVALNQTHDSHRRSVSENKEEADELAAEVGRSSWLKDCVDRLSASMSSRAMSFRSSGRFFGGSSRRSVGEVVTGAGDQLYDVEEGNSRIGEEISEFFRWFSGV